VRQFERDPMVRSMLQRFGGKISEVKRSQGESDGVSALQQMLSRFRNCRKTCSGSDSVIGGSLGRRRHGHSEMNGQKQIVDIRIEPTSSLQDQEDACAGLVRAAVNEASRRVDENSLTK